MKLSYKGLVFAAGFLWLAVGIGLGTAGARWSLRYDRKLWIAVALLIGLAKGIFVIRKSANRTIKRLKSLSFPAPIYKMYSGKMWLLVFVMMGIGMGMRFSGLSYAVRGPICLGVGVALFSGCSAYLTELLRN